jgi:hypothetical protein
VEKGAEAGFDVGPPGARTPADKVADSDRNSKLAGAVRPPNQFLTGDRFPLISARAETKCSCVTEDLTFPQQGVSIMVRNSRLFHLTATLLLGAGLLLACQTAESKTKPHSRPFLAVGVAVWDNIFAAFDPNVGAQFEGSGHGTHLGKFVQVGDLFFYGPPDANGVIPGLGSVTLTAANGDELRFDYIGGLASTTGVGSGTLIFTGGTGRFENATGTGEFYAEIDLSGGPLEAPMTVWLSGRLEY